MDKGNEKDPTTASADNKDSQADASNADDGQQRRKPEAETAERGAGTSLVVITRLHNEDILMGRGAPSAEYMGNARLRRLVLKRREEYMQAPKRKDKHRIAVEIVAEAQQNGGRFLRRIEDEEEINSLAVKEGTAAFVAVHDEPLLLNKVKQLLRDIGPEARKKRAERRQDRKRRRDDWQPPAEKSGPDTGDDYYDGAAADVLVPSVAASGGAALLGTRPAAVGMGYLPLGGLSVGSLGPSVLPQQLAFETNPGLPLSLGPTHPQLTSLQLPSSNSGGGSLPFQWNNSAEPILPPGILRQSPMESLLSSIAQQELQRRIELLQQQQQLQQQSRATTASASTVAELLSAARASVGDSQLQLQLQSQVQQNESDLPEEEKHSREG